MFSKEHSVNTGLVDYCKKEVVQTKDSLETIVNTLENEHLIKRQ
jgi:hypothetical protein